VLRATQHMGLLHESIAWEWLGSTYFELRRLSEARRALVRCLELREKLWGSRNQSDWRGACRRREARSRRGRDAGRAQTREAATGREWMRATLTSARIGRLGGVMAVLPGSISTYSTPVRRKNRPRQVRQEGRRRQRAARPIDPVPKRRRHETVSSARPEDAR
jgi:hypothetical protein